MKTALQQVAEFSSKADAEEALQAHRNCMGFVGGRVFASHWPSVGWSVQILWADEDAISVEELRWLDLRRVIMLPSFTASLVQPI